MRLHIRYLIVFLFVLTSYQSSSASDYKFPTHFLLAQLGEEEAFDPFSDYSEFDEASDEEADIHFFRNGRFLTAGFILGLKAFTDNLSTQYTAGAAYGLFLSYFFDLRSSVQMGFTTDDHAYTFCVSGSGCDAGNVSFTSLQFLYKYYFNTQNVTKGVADLNPYILGGITQMWRTYTVASTVSNSLASARDTTWGLTIGGGIEVPIMRKKGFIGGQVNFHLASFSDANSRLYIDNLGGFTSEAPYGYHYELLGLIGFNF